MLGAVRLGKRSPTVPTIEVKRGEFLDSLQFRGEVKALKSVTISAPAEAGDLQIIKVSAEGTVGEARRRCRRVRQNKDGAGSGAVPVQL